MRLHRVTLSIRNIVLSSATVLFSMGATVALLLVFSPANTTPEQTSIKSSSYQAPALKTVSTPKQLVISSLQIAAPIKQVGLTDAGDMAIDDSIDTVAWYQGGPKPGEKGSAVIAGHYGWKHGDAAIFTELHTIKAGEQVTVMGANNEPQHFTVRLIRSYDPEDDATEVFTSKDGKAHLNLITCDGAWNASLKTYSERLVIFTDKEE